MGEEIREDKRPGTLVRRAVAEDAPRITAVLEAAFARFESLYTPEAMAATVCTPAQVRERMKEGPVWVAVRGGEIVGTVSAVPRAGGVYVRGMAVVPLAQGSGVGHELLKRAEEFAERGGFARIFLSTTPYLADAIRLYERHGFRRSGEGPYDLFGTPLFTMEKILKSAGGG